MGGPTRVIYGYGGTSEVMAAFDRAELTGLIQCNGSDVRRLFPEWLDQQILVPVFYFGVPPSDSYLDEMGEELPHEIMDLPGVDYTDVGREAWEADLNLAGRTHNFVAPAGTPDDIVGVWEDALGSLAASEEYREAMIVAGLEEALDSHQERNNVQLCGR